MKQKEHIYLVEQSRFPWGTNNWEIQRRSKSQAKRRDNLFQEKDMSSVNTQRWLRYGVKGFQCVLAESRRGMVANHGVLCQPQLGVGAVS